MALSWHLFSLAERWCWCNQRWICINRFLRLHWIHLMNKPLDMEIKNLSFAEMKNKEQTRKFNLIARNSLRLSPWRTRAWNFHFHDIVVNQPTSYFAYFLHYSLCNIFYYFYCSWYDMEIWLFLGKMSVKDSIVVMYLKNLNFKYIRVPDPPQRNKLTTFQRISALNWYFHSKFIFFRQVCWISL